jgi:hypothetical protein
MDSTFYPILYLGYRLFFIRVLFHSSVQDALFLRYSFEKVPLGTSFHQRDYAASNLTDFSMADYKPAYIPLLEGLILVSNMKTKNIDSTYYYQLVGKLIFLTITRPDISYAVSWISSYMSQPQHAHLEATKHILCYIQHILDYGILYKAGLPLTLFGYANLD